MNDKKNPLQVIQDQAPDKPTIPEIVQKKTETENAAKKNILAGNSTPFELPDSYLLAKEMQEMFDEDIVTHVQGPSTPEAE